MTAALDTYLDQLAAHAELHGVIAVFADGAPLAQRAFGLADSQGTARNGIDSRFRVGSLSKSFTAAAILTLAQQGQLDLADPVTRYLPECGLDPRITLHQLLRHRSGLGNHTALPDYWPTLMQTPQAPEVLIRRVAAAPLLAEPGDASHYSNTGYLALARVAERVSDQPFHALLDALFWRPLGLSQTGAMATATNRGHQLLAGRPHALSLDPSVAFGAYDLAASAGDLARWWLALNEGAVLDAQHTALMMAGPTGDFGCGWWLDELVVDGQRWRSVGHMGDVNGYTAMLLGLPARRTCAVVLFNTASTPALATARRVLGLALGETRPAYPPAIAATAPWASDRYRDGAGTQVQLDAERGWLDRARDYGAPCRYRIRPHADNGLVQYWRADAFDERLELHRDGWLRVIAPDGATRDYVRETAR
ncbi:serine hydrolase domain-containing protein [Chitinolyticbacter albus]|uniref:serine hydrolase domain-containing protein n=1 Tax=Chitinolyticbacter albus TaxID=2961951 RepID=UPI00210C93FC|nr:serine hydrolase domain-containing protein [Chitinolyticbacter albus]